jgi:hypothetical protein
MLRPGLHLDLEMLVNLGGRERTEEQFRALFAASGFCLSRSIPFGDGTPFCIFEALPVSGPGA